MTLAAKNTDQRYIVGRTPDQPATIAWEFDECTDRTASGFARLSAKIEKAGLKHVLLSFGRCRFLSVRGISHLLEFYADLESRGISIRVVDLSPMLEYVFELAKLDWILADKSPR